MHVLISVLLWLTAVATSVQADDLSANLDLPDFKDHITVFDITTKAPVKDVKAALLSFTTIDLSFKVVGEDRLFFVIRSNNTNALRDVTFPQASKVTQHPVELMKEFLDMYNAGSGWEKIFAQMPAMDTNLLFLDWEIIVPKTMCLTTFEILLREWAGKFKESYNTVKPIIFPVLGSYPPRFFFMIDIKEKSMQNMVKTGVNILGGPGISTMIVKRIVAV